MMLDLDGFKAFNDACGHPAGDALLRDASAAMAGCVRATDQVYRYGGDEFAVLLPGAGSATASDIKARIEDAVARLGSDGQPPVERQRRHRDVPESGPTTKAILAVADERLYREKRVRDRQALEVQLAALGNGSGPAEARGPWRRRARAPRRRHRAGDRRDHHHRHGGPDPLREPGLRAVDRVHPGCGARPEPAHPQERPSVGGVLPVDVEHDRRRPPVARRARGTAARMARS